MNEANKMSNDFAKTCPELFFGLRLGLVFIDQFLIVAHCSWESGDLTLARMITVSLFKVLAGEWVS